MWKEIWDTAEYFVRTICSRPEAAVLGAVFGALLNIIFPNGLHEPIGLVAMVTIDTMTGRSAARARGEVVKSGDTRRMTIRKCVGYLTFVVSAGIASYVTKDNIWAHGAMGLAISVELLSIAENLYDMGLIDFDPRKVSLFSGIVDAFRKKRD